MNIWNWIEKLTDDLDEAGHEDAAANIYDLANQVCEFEYERAASLVQEIKALGKSIDNPWLEVFAGHWEMRNRLGFNFEGERALPDAVRLFEFAHRDNTKDCPQSVCVTQDISTCYGNIDGPGWVEERVAVCDETLARINPQWACFQCLSSEKAYAISEAGRSEEAIVFFDQQLKAVRKAGVETDEETMLTQIGLLILAKRYEEALKLINKNEKEYPDSSKQSNESRNLKKIEVLAKLGRHKEAWDLLPPIAEVAYFHRPIWIRAVSVLIERAPDRNDWCLGTDLQHTLDHFSRVGSHRPLIDAALLCARLALKRNSLWGARRILDLARRHLPKLRADLGASAALDALQADIDQAAHFVQPLPVPTDQLVQWLVERGEKNQSRNPEEEIEWLLTAHREHPDDIELLHTVVDAHQACAADDEALELMWRFAERHTDKETSIVSRLLGSLLATGKADQVERLAGMYRESQPVFALWCEARRGFHDDNWPMVIESCRKLLELAPNSQGARGLLARALRKQGDYREAADCYRIMSESLKNPVDALWDYMTVSCILQDWDAVRASAKKLQIELSTDQGPIEEEWGPIIIRYYENGNEVDYYAQRTGPVTARILENALPGNTQHIGDWVAFDGSPLMEAPEDEEERKNFIPTYAIEHILEPGGFGTSWLVDGVFPGDEAYQAFRDAIEQLGCHSWVHSGQDYSIIDGENGKEHPAFYFSIAAPQSVSVQELDKLLGEHTGKWKHRLSWVQLADAAGVSLDPHIEVIERYGL